MPNPRKIVLDTNCLIASLSRHSAIDCSKTSTVLETIGKQINLGRMESNAFLPYYKNVNKIKLCWYDLNDEGATIMPRLLAGFLFSRWKC